jgi:hypothetical protein
MTTIKVNTITDAAGTGAPNIPDGILIKGATLANANTLDYYAQGTEPSSPNNAAVWYDTGTDQFKMYVGGAWVEVSYTTKPPGYIGDRGVFGGGNGNSDVIDYIAIPTPSNATDFGDLVLGRLGVAACAANGRGVFAGGYNTGLAQAVDTIEYITISTTGNTTDFGDLTIGRYSGAGCSSNSRGVFGGGTKTSGGTANTNIIDYITIATTGNATDFGDLLAATSRIFSCSDGTYGLFGQASSNVIQYITIATTGNAIDFGDLLVTPFGHAGCSDGTYGLIGGGGNTTPTTTINYVTIATPGNATDFGDLTVGRIDLSACANLTYGVFAGGYTGSFVSNNTIDYVTVGTPGNATDFGDLTVARQQLGGCSGD